MRRPNILLFSGIALAFYAAMLVYFNSGGILLAVKNFSPVFVMPIFLCMALSYVFKYSRWVFFLRSAGVFVPAARLFPIFVASLSMLVTPGKVGDILKSYLMKKKFGYPKRKTLPSVLMERITDLPALAIFSVAGVYAVYPHNSLVLFPFFILVLFIFAVRSKAVFEFILGLVQKSSRLRRYGRKISGLYSNTRFAASYRNLVVGSGIGMAGWFVEGLILYSIMRGLGVAGIDVLLSVSIYIISVIAGVVSFIPGGLGASEASMFGLLVIAGVSKPDALAATIIFRALTLWMSLAVGSIALSYVEGKKNG